MSDSLVENKNNVGIDFKLYKEIFVRQVEEPNLLDQNELKFFEYRKLNLQRTNRLEKTFVPSDSLINLVSKIDKHQTWIVITESWCGDSAQNLPIITKAASLNDNINLRIVLRDDNLELMDRYLTNGSRSIPKLVVFDKENNELFQWGPRPAEVQNLYNRLKNEGVEKSEINKELQLWYGRNRGKEVERELITLLNEALDITTIK